MIKNIQIRIEDGREMDGAILVRTSRDNEEWIEICSSETGEGIVFPNSLIADMIKALTILEE
jgi:hypothetical protein